MWLLGHSSPTVYQQTYLEQQVLLFLGRLAHQYKEAKMSELKPQAQWELFRCLVEVSLSFSTLKWKLGRSGHGDRKHCFHN